ncbi:DUF4252 domain-containing protein [Reichenbachiella versicolor]|uniref:DUF4252 domain-containing protein n=1 Tax=Reichenbachiella versicolor TaxID=1821036 RepID=UPI0013A56930|nr:DUF4252 domain-containing protein [Reichenbachiella versicolor]
MKTIKIFILSCLFALQASAQDSPVDQLFNKYSDKDGFTSVYISKYMFGLFSNSDSEDKDEDDMSNVLSGLESIRILTVEDKEINNSINLYDEIIKDISLSEYEQLMVVKEKGQDIRMMVRKEQGKIVDFLMIGGGSDNFLISINGNLDLDAISKLSDTMDIDGLENVEKLKE